MEPENGFLNERSLVVHNRQPDHHDNRQIVASKGNGAIMLSAQKRTSSLQAPIMQLEGHQGEVYSMQFSPDGQSIVSGSFDKLIYLWRVYGNCENYMVFKGHKNAILQVEWSSDSTTVYSASADKTAGVWDCQHGARTKKLSHTAIVNSISVSKRDNRLFTTAGNDNLVLLWDTRQKKPAYTITYEYPVTAVQFIEEKNQIYTGGIDNIIRQWDIRTNSASLSLLGHTDTVTGLKLDPFGVYLLSSAMDNTVRVWDIRPFAPDLRCVKILLGASHNFERSLLRCAWAPDGSMVTTGSADRFVYIWDTTTRKIKYKLPGHKGSVNEVVFHPKEPIIGSCSSDKTIFLGEIEEYQGL